ncbi:META domain-containing protein [Myroides injenensis]|uniref:META domain-containing protein n=1 Tax=Myroides injenensis TaxID=1183151 RepID=UPI002271BF7E|nr:META domain-containing protein [Myroides injenensis]
MKKTVLFLALALSVSLVSCKDKKETKAEEKTEQTTTTAEVKKDNGLLQSWELVSITTPDAAGKTIDELFPNAKPALTFQDEEVVFGTDGCNNISGSYEAKGNNGIAIGEKLAVTKRFCEGVADTTFLNALSLATTYDIVEDELLFNSGDIVIMKFKKVDAAK